MRKKDSRPLTKADKEAAMNLKAIAGREGISQKALGAKVGMSQSGVNQYLNGGVALGVVATLRFARALEVSPTDIRSDFDYTDMVPGELPQDVLKIAAELVLLSPEVRADVAEIINGIRKHGSSYHQLLRKFRSANA